LAKREEASQAISDMREQGVIEPSARPWAFAGGRLTFLKLGLASAGFGGCVWNFF